MKIEPRHLSLVDDFRAKHRAGLMTLLFTDLAGSTKLKSELGDAVAGAILQRHHSLVREVLKSFPEAREVSTAGDSFFLVFDSPSNAVIFALRLHRALRELSTQVGHKIRDRVGIHVGEVFFEHGETAGRVQNYSGIHVDTCARVMGICAPGRILLTRFAFDNAQQIVPTKKDKLGPLGWISHGLYELKGVSQPLEICEVFEKGKARPEAPLDGEKARRFIGSEIDRAKLAEAQEAADDWLGLLRRRRKEIALTTLVALTLLLVTLSSTIYEKLSSLSYDSSYFLAPSASPKEAILVLMDEQSHTTLHQPDNAPWDHALYARLVRRMTEAGAKAVVFDIIFTEPQTNSEQFVSAAAENGKVFAAALEREVNKKGLAGWQIFKPFEELSSVVQSGVVEGGIKGAAIQKQYEIQTDAGVKTLAELVATKAGGAKVSKERPKWLHYYGPPQTLPHISFAQALSTNGSPDALFKDKLVFVGATSEEAYSAGRGTNDYLRTYDEFATPFTRWGYGKSSGVEINATACLNLLRGETLRQISPWTEMIVLVVSTIGLVVGAALLTPLSATIVAAVLAVGVAIAANGLVWVTHYWFDWTLICFIQIPAILFCSVALRTQRLGRQKRELEKALVTQHTEFVAKASVLQPATESAVVERPVVVEGERPPIPDYELFSVVGKGGYGEVWLGRDLTHSFRTIKIIRSKTFGSNRPFEREFEGIKRFAPISRSHPGLVDVLHVGMNEVEGWFYYIMEAADDVVMGREIEPARYTPKTLKSILDGPGRLGAASVLTLGIRLADALQFLHEHGLLHRDIKPANVLFVGGMPQLADPGLVAEADGGGTQISMVGTAGYMAPDATATPASDVYSLGKVLYQVGFGRPVSAFPELPTEFLASPDENFLLGLNDIVLKACARDLSERYSTAAELRAALEALGKRIQISDVGTELKDK